MATIPGTSSADSLSGTAEDDLIEGLEGNDELDGQDGNDTLIGGPGADTMRGGEGTDTADYSASTSNIQIYARDAIADVFEHSTSGGEWADFFEAFRTGSGDDSFDASASSTAYLFDGGAGNDAAVGSGGNDTLIGGAGDDTLIGGEGTDRVVFAGNMADYTLTNGQDADGEFTLVTDNDPTTGGNDGTDKVYSAEALVFSDASVVICFYPGTLVATPSGERAVETLRAGDLVLTAEGEARPIRWLGRQTVSTRFGDPLRVLPIRVAAGALGENLPKRDLLVSPDHALLVDGVLVQAGALVNGTTVRRERAVPEVFTYWHVELHDHSLVLAEGVPAETFIDNVDRLAFDNWDEHEAAGSEAPIAEMALPRAKSARQVPQAIRRRLAERAARLPGTRVAVAA